MAQLPDRTGSADAGGVARLMSQLEERVDAGTFVVTSELLTVDSGGLAAVRDRFEPFAPWVDAVNATDNTAAHAHASPVAVAIALKLLGVEPVMQLVCRDRNRLALQADIVGFSAFLTTTMPMFKANINALDKAGIRGDVIVMVGGAPVTQEYADAVGADGYAADASTAVRLAKDLIEQRRAAGLETVS